MLFRSAALQARLNAESGLSEPGVFAELAALLPAGVALFAGNSMPVRDLDTFFPGDERPLRFLVAARDDTNTILSITRNAGRA